MTEGRHWRVLVANDDAPLAESVRRLLREEDYEVRLALDGEAALQAFAQWPADLVLLDLIMPGLDGWRFLERRSRDTSLAQVPVLVWSVGASDELELARRLGADQDCPGPGLPGVLGDRLGPTIGHDREAADGGSPAQIESHLHRGHAKI